MILTPIYSLYQKSTILRLMVSQKVAFPLTLALSLEGRGSFLTYYELVKIDAMLL